MRAAALTRPDLRDMVHELTNWHTHREHYQVRRGVTWFSQDHVTNVPPLLTQLREASPSGNGEDRGTAGYGSRPTARLEAIDCLAHIDTCAARWVRSLGADDVHGDTAATVRQLHGLAAGTDAATRREVERDVRAWWAYARIVSGWDSPAWRPDNTCPQCAQRGSLRVRLAEQIGTCTDCRAVWDSTTIGLLADHIRLENHEEGTEDEVDPGDTPVSDVARDA